MVEDEQVVRLWCFVPISLVPLIPQVNRQFRWARIYPADDMRPNWSHSFSGRAFVLCETYGEYNGYFGGRGKLGKAVPDREELVREYHKKHPTWKEAKIERAVDESIAKASREADTFHTALEPGELLSFLRSLCAAGPVVLVLSDGGTKDPEIGGTGGLPVAERHPRFDKGQTVYLKDFTTKDVILLDYWVPITIIPESES